MHPDPREKRKGKHKRETMMSTEAELVAKIFNKKWENPELVEVDFHFVDLTSVDLTDANLTRAILNNTILIDADLSGADLSDADLSRADLSGANLSDADLSGADLSDARLFGTNLSGAIVNDLTKIGPNNDWINFNGKMAKVVSGSISGDSNKFVGGDNLEIKTALGATAGITADPTLNSGNSATVTPIITATGGLHVEPIFGATPTENAAGVIGKFNTQDIEILNKALVNFSKFHGNDTKHNHRPNTQEVPIPTDEIEAIIKSIEFTVFVAKSDTQPPNLKAILNDLKEYLEWQIDRLKEILLHKHTIALGKFIVYLTGFVASIVTLLQYFV
ncbi:MAG: pentapeptide repeat-containing protein [Sneathiella sp.]